MKTPSADDRIVAVTGYITDERFGYDHWQATQFLVEGHPVSDIVRPGVLVLATDKNERDTIMLVVEQALAPKVAPSLVATGSAVMIAEAAERLQAAIYGLPPSQVRTLMLADTVVIMQELSRLVAPAGEAECLTPNERS